MVGQGLGWGEGREGRPTTKAHEETFGMMEMFYNLIVVTVAYINLGAGTSIKWHTFKGCISLYVNYAFITLIKKKKVLVEKMHTYLLSHSSGQNN